MARTFLNAIFVAWRSGEIALRFSPLILLVPAAILSAATDGLDGKKSRVSDWAWNYSLYTIQTLGPAFVKICQWGATRRDLFPAHVCDRLSKLHDATFQHSWKHTHEILSKAFGEDYGTVGGLTIDQNDVIGSGSVAQVYKGTLNRNGVEKMVAVKILHPNIHGRIERDLSLMQRVASLVDSLPSETIRMMNLPRVAANFSDIMRHQIDLRNEKAHLERFRDNFLCDDALVGKVSFPQPIFAEADCLVEDYEDAVPISQFLKDDSPSGMALRRRLAGPLLRAFLKMVFMDNFVHSDLHQGNVQVRKTSVPIAPLGITRSDNGDTKHYDDKYTIVFLDAGIVTTLSKEDQQNLKDLFKAVIMNNGEEAGRLMVERAKYERCSQVEGGIEKFSIGVGEIVSEFHDRRKQGLTLGVVRIGTLLSKVLDLCRIHAVEIDPAMSNIVMSTLVLEGLGRSLDEDLNLFDIAIPFVLGRGKV